MRKIAWSLLGADIVLAVLALIIGIFLRFGQAEGIQELFDNGLVRVLPYVGTVISCGFFCELYSKEHRSQGAELAARIAVSVMAALLVLSAFYYIVPAAMIGRGYLSLALLMSGFSSFFCAGPCSSSGGCQVSPSGYSFSASGPWRKRWKNYSPVQRQLRAGRFRAA
ncbi:MAG: hypothetical protein R2864_13790 [Syntrophotaleaceae bacterium]